MLMSKSSSMTSLSNVILAIIGMLLLVAQVSMAMKEIRFASPLQSLTIPDPELFSSDSSTNNENDNEDENENGVSSMSRLLETPRKRFLPRFLAGLKAEDKVREGIAIGQVKVPDGNDDHDFSGSDWVGKIKSIEERRKYQEDQVVGKAHDSAVQLFEQKLRKNKKVKQENSNQYQIVGVINSSSRNNTKKKKNKKQSNGPISWYARPKPKNAKWTIRMIHVNKDAIIKDLFDRGKIDIFAKYTNTGRTSTTSDIDKQRQLEQKEEKLAQEGTSTTSSTTRKEGLVPIVTTKYEARERSWKTLWNFSPKHFFTDPSGAYWRERRIHSHDSWWSSDRSSGLGGTGGSRSSSGQTLYTDGDNVYESSYRYRDGRNGMHYVSTLQQFLVSSQTGITDKQKQQVLKKLQSKAPDIVVEEL
mmetsp:Transcript_48185/g.53713  ORF Transcript_48185/g.53713 Transcript_48185/m.53713 type:complete len:416 (+) Transcript_48185:31-1278(+)